MAKNVFDADDFVDGKSFEELKKTMESFFQVMDKGFESFGKSLDEIKKKQTASKTAFDNGVKSLDELQKAAISQTRITNDQKESMRALRDEILKNAQAYQKYDKAIDSINDSLKGEKGNVEDLKKAYDSMRKNVEGNVKSTKENAKATKQSIDANVDLAKKVRELEKAYIAARQAGDDVTAGKLKDELKETAAAFIKIKNEVNSVKKEIRDNEKDTKNLSTAYGRLKIEARDAANEAKELGAKLGTESPEFLKAAKRAKVLSDELKEIEGSVGQFQRDVGNYSKALDGLKEGFLGAASGGLDLTSLIAGGGLFAAGQMAAELFAQGAMQLYESLSLASQQLREVSTLSNKTGEDLRDLTSSAQALADTFDTDFTQTIEAATKAEKQFGVTGEEAFDVLSKGLVQAGSRGDELLEGINEYGSNAQKLGFSFEEFVGITSTAAQNGAKDIDRAGDLINNAAIELQRLKADDLKGILKGEDLKQAEKILKGVQSGAIEGKDALNFFLQKTEDLGVKSRESGELISKIFTSVGEEGVSQEFLDSIRNVDDSVKNLSENLTDAEKNQIALAKANKASSDALLRIGEALNFGSGGFDVFLENLKATVLEGILFLVEGIQEVGREIGQFIDDVIEIGEFFLFVNKSIMDFIGISDILTSVFDFISDAVTSLTGDIDDWGEVMTNAYLFMNPVIRGFMLMKEGVSQVAEVLPKAKAFVEAYFAALKVLKDALIDLAMDGLQPVIDAISKVLERFKAAGDFLSKDFTKGFNFVIKTLTDLSNSVLMAFGIIENAGDSAADGIMSSFMGIVEPVLGFFRKIANAALSLLPDSLKETFAGSVKAFEDTYNSAMAKIKKDTEAQKAENEKAEKESKQTSSGNGESDGQDGGGGKADLDAIKKRQKEVNDAVIKARQELNKALVKSNINRLNEELEGDENSLQDRINIYNEINNIQIQQAEEAAEIAKKEAKEKAKSQEEYAVEVEKIELELADKKESINRDTTDSIKAMQDELVEKQKEIAEQVIQIEQETKDIKDDIKDLETEASLRALEDQIDLNNQRLENEKLSLDEKMALISQNAELEKEIQRELTKQALEELEKRRLAEISAIDAQIAENARLSEEQPELAVDLFKKNEALLEQKKVLEEKYATERVMVEQESAQQINQIQEESAQQNTQLIANNAQKQREFLTDTVGGGVLSTFEDAQQKRINAIEDEDKKLKQQLLLKLQMMTLEIALAKLRNPDADVTGQISSLGSTAIAGLLGGGLYEGGYTGSNSLFTDMNGRKAVDFVHENEWVASAKVAKVNAKSANIVKHLEAFQRTGNEVFIDKITGKYDDYKDRDIQFRYELSNPTNNNMEIDYNKLSNAIASQIPSTDIRKEADGHVFREKTSRSLKEIKVKDRIKRYRMG